MNWTHIHKQITGSTNEDAFLIGKDGGAAWTVCTADCQTDGKGRLNRKWYSPSGNGLYISILIRPVISPDEIGLLSLCAANAMSGVLRNNQIPVLIKWPNDIVLKKKKICGILSSCSMKKENIDFCVIGAGLNLLCGSFPKELSEQATSLEDEGFTMNRDSLIDQYVAFLQEEIGELETDGVSEILARYTANCVTIGSRIAVSGTEELTGFAEGLNEKGELILRDDQNEFHTVRCGDVSVRGLMGYV